MDEFGKKIKSLRARSGLSLRQLCKEHGLDASNWSKLERGRLSPPKGERLDGYGKFLGLEPGSTEWNEFQDLAATAAGRIPEELRDSKLAAKLPVLFRTLIDADNQGGGDSEALLEELIRKIRDA